MLDNRWKLYEWFSKRVSPSTLSLFLHCSLFLFPPNYRITPKTTIVFLTIISARTREPYSPLQCSIKSWQDRFYEIYKGHIPTPWVVIRRLVCSSPVVGSDLCLPPHVNVTSTINIMHYLLDVLQVWSSLPLSFYISPNTVLIRLSFIKTSYKHIILYCWTQSGQHCAKKKLPVHKTKRLIWSILRNSQRLNICHPNRFKHILTLAKWTLCLLRLKSNTIYYNYSL